MVKTKNINKIKRNKYEIANTSFRDVRKQNLRLGKLSASKQKTKKNQQVKSIKVVNCNINAAIKLQCTYNDAIRTLFAQCTQSKYRNLSTNNMCRY